MTDELIPILQRSYIFEDNIAFETSTGDVRYRDLRIEALKIASGLRSGHESFPWEPSDLRESRIAMLIQPGPSYAALQWGIWQAGGVVLPLSLSGTQEEWSHCLIDAQVSLIVTQACDVAKMTSLASLYAIPVITIDQLIELGRANPLGLESAPEITAERRAMILYTSGTTSKPKGVVTTHANVQAQIETLVKAWEWTSRDRIPLFLPLHHIHGIINVLSCALWSGAKIEAFPGFDLSQILPRIREGRYTLFMAVPTIYVKLIEALDRLDVATRSAIVGGFSKMRLMVSGSAALPAHLHQRWYELTNQKLLERYGMTEIGMAISNPLHGKRLPGKIGQSLPGVDVRLVDESGAIVSQEKVAGEIQVRGPGVFLEYWGNPAATEQSFVQGWFRTGDIAEMDGGYYRILGRASVDIIKSGGYKLSALEIEAVLLEHPRIRQCAVVGIEDQVWGEAVCAAVVCEVDQEGLTIETVERLKGWCKDRMSAYKIPKRWLVLRDLPRNAMGKVTKPEVRDLFIVSQCSAER